MIHPEEARGPQGLAEMVQVYRDALSGLNVTIEQQFTEGDYVATRTTIRGRHDGDLMGAPPPGATSSSEARSVAAVTGRSRRSGSSWT